MEGELMKYQDQVIQKEINILVEVQIVIPIVQFQLVAGIVTSQNLLFQMREDGKYAVRGLWTDESVHLPETKDHAVTE